MPVQNLLLFLGSFALIWIGAGLILSSVDKLAKQFKISSFAFSFFLLGILTSIPELGVGLTAVSEKRYDVFVGNLLGGIPMIFLLVIPVFTILCGKLSLSQNINRRHLLFSLIAVSLPSLLCLDGTISRTDAIILLLTYGLHVVYIETSKTALNNQQKNTKSKNFSLQDVVKVLVGTVAVFLASHVIVDQTLFFAAIYSLSPFFISLIFISIGTNIPELSLSIRAALGGEKSVAFGDYIGSAAANVLLLGIFTLMSSGTVSVSNNPISVFVFTAGGAALFYLLIRSKNTLTRREGVILLLVYFAFIYFEYLL